MSFTLAADRSHRAVPPIEGPAGPPAGPSRWGTARLVGIMALWAVCYPLISVGLPYAPPLFFAALRAVLAAAFLLAAGAVAHRRWPAGTSTWLLLGLAGLGATSLGFLGMFSAGELVSPGVASVVAGAQPLLAAALGSVILRERAGARGVLGLLLGFSGIVALAGGNGTGDGGYGTGIGFIALAAVGVTVSNVILSHLAGRVDPIMGTGVQLAAGAIPLAVAATLTENPSDIVWSPAFAASLAGLAIPGTALAYGLWFSALRTTPLTEANAFTFLVPVFGVALAVALTGESFTAATALAIALTVAGVALVHRSATRRDPPGGGSSAACPAPAHDAEMRTTSRPETSLTTSEGTIAG